MGAVAFFITFQKYSEAEWQLSVNFQPGPTGFEKGHQLALVVAGTPSEDAFLAVSAFSDLWFKWGALPQADRVRRLDIIVTIKEDVGRVGRQSLGPVFSNYDRLAGSGAELGLEAHLLKGAPQPLGSIATGGVVLRVGCDSRKAEQLKKAIEAQGKVFVNRGKNLIDGRQDVTKSRRLLNSMKSLTPWVHPARGLE
jgi:hypothetical protein